MNKIKILQEKFPNKHEFEIALLLGEYSEETPIEEIISIINSDDKAKKTELEGDCEHLNSLEFFFQINSPNSIKFLHLHTFSLSESNNSIDCLKETHTITINGFNTFKTKIPKWEFDKYVQNRGSKRIKKIEAEKYILDYRNAFFASFEPFVKNLK